MSSSLVVRFCTIPAGHSGSREGSDECDNYETSSMLLLEDERVSVVNDDCTENTSVNSDTEDVFDVATINVQDESAII